MKLVTNQRTRVQTPEFMAFAPLFGFPFPILASHPLNPNASEGESSGSHGGGGAGAAQPRRVSGVGLPRGRLLREARADRRGHIRVRVYRPLNLSSPFTRIACASVQFGCVVLVVVRQVFMAKDTDTKEIVALKKIRMDNEREGVSVLVHCFLFLPS